MWERAPPGQLLLSCAVVSGFIDLHSHWVAGVDDGAQDVEASLALLEALHVAGFERVIATPHMRPGMFDNTADDLRRAFADTKRALAAVRGLPELDLASEHFFDDIVFQRFCSGEVLPYPGGHAALVEVSAAAFPTHLGHRFFDLVCRRLTPVLAHPERYKPVWKDQAVLHPLLDTGALLLLDVAALAGRYGRSARHAAEGLVEAGYYQAACSDAHQVEDVKDVVAGIRRLYDMVGSEEATFLLREGPLEILEGRVDRG